MISNESAVYNYITTGNLFNLYLDDGKYSSSGLSFTVDKANGTVTVDGKNLTNANYTMWISSKSYNFPFDVIISGCPADSTTNTYYLGGTSVGAVTDRKLITAGNNISVTIVVREQVICNNVVFKPLIKPAYLNDDTYSPYTRTIQELTKNIMDLNTNTPIVRSIYFDPTLNADVQYKQDFISLLGLRVTTDVNFVWRFTPTSNYPDVTSFIITRYAIYTFTVWCSNGIIKTLNLNRIALNHNASSNPYDISITKAEDSTYFDIRPYDTWSSLAFFGTALKLTDWNIEKIIDEEPTS